MDKMGVGKAAVKNYLKGLVVIILVLFLPAGTFYYWQAWLYIGILFIPMLFVAFYLLRKNPGLLASRMQFKEKEPEQDRIQKVGSLIYIVTFLIPGIDYRLNLSDVPTVVVIFSDLAVVVAYSLVVLVLRENSYAFRTVEIQADQKLVDSGPYKIVRHPMYAGILLMMLFTPTALGSYYALVTLPLVASIFILRIKNEEKVLLKGLPGYGEYCLRTKYRLVPFVW